MQDEESIKLIAQQLGIGREDNFSLSRQLLKEKINELIQTDFHRLISILYRVDVSEAKLKYLLSHHADEDAAEIITDMLIERQLEKIKSRQLFKGKDDISEEEKW